MNNKKVSLYCSEQIRIPDKLPDIIKEYCKAAIKTQPYDLLKWSTSYFRSLANDLPPIVKDCLEKETQSKYITKGCLRMLIEHIGKGFFVHRRILKKIWETILPMDELYKFLSLGRMLYWRELHWLKLIGLMAGSISNDLRGTMLLICELLTNDIEGGSAKIPIWMFLTIYKYLATLDCSKEQRIFNGRREMENGTFEELAEPNELPYVMSALSLNKCLMESCITNENNKKDKNADDINEVEQFDNKNNEQIDEKESWLDDFKMYGKITEPKRILSRCRDFDTLIFYIKTHHIQKNLSVKEGPHHIHSRRIKSAKEKEKKIALLREKYDILYRENVVYPETFQDKVNMLKEIGPPWSWIFDFTAYSGQNKSYNFIDNESIISDKTPETSSDESFDFVAQKPIAYCDDALKDDVASVDNVSSYRSSSDEKNISDLLINRRSTYSAKPRSTYQIDIDKSIILDGSQKVKRSPLEFENVINEFETILQDPSEGSISSDYEKNIVAPDLHEMLEAVGEKTQNNIEFDFIVDVLRVALEKNMNFTKIDEVLNYIRSEYAKWFAKIDDNLETIEKEDKQDDSECFEDLDWVKKENISELSKELTLSEYNYATGDYTGSRAVQKECIEPKSPKSPKPVTPPPPPKSPIKNLENTFGDDITIDPKVKNRKIDKDMILGLVSGSEHSISTKPNEPSSEISEPSLCIDHTGYYSDDSSIFPLPEIEKDEKIKFKEYKQTCELPRENEKIYDYKIPKLPGIGGRVSDKIMSKFIEFMEYCAYKQQGMVQKSNLLEEKCPALEDLSPHQSIENELMQSSNNCPNNLNQTVQ